MARFLWALDLSFYDLQYALEHLAVKPGGLAHRLSDMEERIRALEINTAAAFTRLGGTTPRPQPAAESEAAVGQVEPEPEPHTDTGRPSDRKHATADARRHGGGLPGP